MRNHGASLVDSASSSRARNKPCHRGLQRLPDVAYFVPPGEVDISASAETVLRAAVRSLVRIRQNRDELVAYIAHRWKMDKEFAVEKENFESAIKMQSTFSLNAIIHALSDHLSRRSTFYASTSSATFF
jgi:hypothetical protein